MELSELRGRCEGRRGIIEKGEGGRFKQGVPLDLLSALEILKKKSSFELC
jgi:hypothetical protein